jgi:hypothetical protein
MFQRECRRETPGIVAQIERGGYDRGALPPPPLGGGARSGAGPAWDRDLARPRNEPPPLLPPARDGSREAWPRSSSSSRDGGRLPPPPARRERGDRDRPRASSADVEAGELLPPERPRAKAGSSAASGWDLLPSPAASQARSSDSRGIGRTSSLPAAARSSAAHAEPALLPSSVSADYPPPLLRAPLRPPPEGFPAANGDHATRGAGASFGALPHHLAERSTAGSSSVVSRARLIPPGISASRPEPAALPPVPPLAPSPVLDAAAPADGGELRPAAPASPFRGLLQPADDAEHGGAYMPASSEKEDGATPASDDPPKRKRLGWGQGLARLRSCDKRGSNDPSGAQQQAGAEPHSPAHADSNASAHAAAPFESPALAPISSAEAADAPQAAPQEAAEQLPAPPPLLLVDPAQSPALAGVVAPEPDPAAAAPADGPGSSQQHVPLASSAVLAPPSILSSSVQSPLPPMPLSPPPPLPSPEQPKASDAATPNQAPASTPVPPQPLPLLAAAVMHAPAAEAAAAAAAEQARLAKQAAKDAILKGIDGVDADIEALEAQLAQLSSEAGAEDGAARLLQQDIAALEAPVQRPLEPLPLQDAAAAAAEPPALQASTRTASNPGISCSLASPPAGVQHEQFFPACHPR